MLKKNFLIENECVLNLYEIDNNTVIFETRANQ